MILFIQWKQTIFSITYVHEQIGWPTLLIFYIVLFQTQSYVFQAHRKCASFQSRSIVA